MNDIGIQPVGIPMITNTKQTKSYLVVMSEQYDRKTKVIKYFITTDAPIQLNGFIQVKGIFMDGDEKDIAENYTAYLTNSPKDLILEVMIPWHKIDYVRSLVFKAK